MSGIARLIAISSFALLHGITLVAQVTPLPRPVPTAQAKYTGPLRAEGARISADLSGTVAATNVEFQLANPSGQQVQENVALVQSKLARPTRVERLSVPARSFVPVRASYQYVAGGDKLKAVRLDPRIELGGRPWLERVKSAVISVKLPAGVHQLVYSSLPNGVVSKDPDGRSIVTYSLNNQYLVPITLKWNSEVQLEIRKTASRQLSVLSVQVAVKNVGSNVIGDMVVSDNFHPGFVQSGTPRSEFALFQGSENDRRLVWRHNLTSLAPGDTAVLKYQLVLRSLPSGLKFSGTTVGRRDTGELLGASTPLIVPQ